MRRVVFNVPIFGNRWVASRFDILSSFEAACYTVPVSDLVEYKI